MKKGRLFFLILTTACIVLSAVSTPQKTVKPPVFSKLKMPAAKPDLVISNGRFEIQGTNVRAFVTILNSGNAGAVFQAGQTMVELVICGKNHKSNALPGGYFLGAGLTAECNVTIPCPPEGAYPATWTVDPGHLIDDKNAANNVSHCQLVVPSTPKPDLVIANFSVQPVSGPPSTVFTLLVTVANQGDANSPGCTAHIPAVMLDGCYVDVLGNGGMPSLAVGKSYTYTLKTKYPLVPGSHVFSVNVDRSNTLAEKIENNNCSSPFTITVTQ